MNQLQITGTQSFMGKDIPVVLGGFGPDKKCISDKTIADIHDQPEREIRKSILRNIGRFKENTDLIDLLKDGNQITDFTICSQLGYSRMEISKAEHIYLLSERGYAKLIKIMDTDLAWEIHDKLIDEYFELREEKARPMTPIEIIAAQAQALLDLEKKQFEQEAELAVTNKRLDNIGEIITLNPNSWRPDARNLIAKIAQKLGGVDFIRDVQAEIFSLVDTRGGVNLKTRLTNMRQRMSLNGVCKSKIDKLNKIDVIAEDKKLIEIYIAVVKEMSVKYGVDVRAQPA